MNQFYLGTCNTVWLSDLDVSLFVSYRRFQLPKPRKRLPVALRPWALDSGGFTELSMYGEWRLKEPEYAAFIRRAAEHIGQLEWAAQMDYMCEPFMLAKTGKTVKEHQQLTVDNYLRLMDQNLPVQVVPVIQGWTHGQYLDCVELFERSGVRLSSLPRVGLGSICRRQNTTRVEFLIRDLAGSGMPLHCFGFKLQGLERVGGIIHSADSMAWSFDARYTAPLPGCTHAKCSNCREWAKRWAEKAWAYSRTNPPTEITA